MFKTTKKLGELKNKNIPKNGNFFSRIWFFISSYKFQFSLYLINRILFFIWFALVPFFIKELVDFVNSPEFSQNPEWAYFYIYLLWWLMFTWFILWLIRVFEIWLRDKIKRQFTIFATEHSLNLWLDWHENQWSWNKMQRIFTAREAIKNLIQLFYWPVLRFIVAVSVMILAIWFSAPFIFIALIISYILIYVIFATILSKSFEKLQAEVDEFYEKVIGKVYEFASSVSTIKFFNLENFVKKRSLESEWVMYWKVWSLNVNIQFRTFFLNIISWIFFVLIWFLSVKYLIEWKISIWVAVMLIYYIWELWDYVESIAEIQESYVTNKTSFMSMVNQLNVKIEKIDFLPLKKISQDWKKIFVKNLFFSYWKKPVLSEINLEINRWERIALVWKSWSWKSTFVKLLMKQVLAKKWWIYFDKTNIENIKRSEILSKSSIVLQDTELFNTSIKENILLNFSWKKPDEEKILKEVLKISHSNIFVDKLDKKEDTVIWEKWVKLSWWERQRIWIARALAKNSEILVFDEATSALDSESEKEIQNAMWNIFKWKTAFVIAHRLSTIKEVDRILVFKDWKIIEDWSFEKLVSEKWEFRKLWDLQKLD